MLISTKLFNRLLLVLLIAAVWSLLGCGGGSSPTEPAMPGMGSAADVVITGQVVSRGTAMNGVKVRVEGANVSSVTDAGGNFDLVGVPAGDRVLVFKHAGESADLQIRDIRPAEQIDLVVALRGSNANLKSMNRSGGTSGGAVVTLQKLTNGEDADFPPGPVIRVDDSVTWEYVIRNGGPVTLTGIFLMDTVIGPVRCPSTQLPPYQTMTCAVTGKAGLGHYRNVGDVSTSEGVTARDPSHYLGTNASINLEKSTNGDEADVPPGPTIPVGDPVSWTYLVTNDGGSDLMDVTVTDDQGVSVDCMGQTTLAVGASMTCTASGTAVEGQYANVGTASGEDPNGAEVSDDDPSHYFGQGTGGGGGGVLTVDIQPDHWNTNWPGSNGTVSAKIHGGDLNGIALDSIILFENDPAVSAAPDDPRITGNHIRARFSKADAFGLLTPPVVPGEVRTITIQFMDNGLLTDLQDDIFIVGPGN